MKYTNTASIEMHKAVIANQSATATTRVEASNLTSKAKTTNKPVTGSKTELRATQREIRLYGEVYKDTTRTEMLTLVKEWAKPLGYYDFQSEDGKPGSFGYHFSNIDQQVQVDESMQHVAYSGDIIDMPNDQTLVYGSLGAIRNFRGSVTNESLYKFKQYVEELLDPKNHLTDYIQDLLDPDYVVCECGEIVYVPQTRTADFHCPACNKLLAEANVDTEFDEEPVHEMYNLFYGEYSDR